VTVIKPNPSSPLIEGFSQHEVDFVIPRVGVDLPLGIDPFLLYKSRDSEIVRLHQNMVVAFNHGVRLISENRERDAQRLFDFPEVQEIGLGYAKNSKRGSGMGAFLGSLVIETLKESPAFRERGIRHIEEMQLVSVGIAQDRTSDMAANLMKRYLVEYTQEQCQQLGIPMAPGVPLQHIFDFENLEWYDDYLDLPLNPIDKSPLLFVPRRLVRALPWINFDDYLRQEFAAYLRAKRVRQSQKIKKVLAPIDVPDKAHIVAVSRTEVERINRFVAKKEEDASQAQPSTGYLDGKETCTEGERLKARLAGIVPGREEAKDYQITVLETLNYLFNPELSDGRMEEETIDGTERRDIIFTNESDQTFWSYLRQEHSSFLMMFEVKNTSDMNNTYLNQTATYLGDRLGYLGFVVTRYKVDKAQIRKTYLIYNDSQPRRKIILFLSDDDIHEMINMKCQGKNPMRHLQNLYRNFRTSVQ
jgi:hypothetical protein